MRKLLLGLRIRIKLLAAFASLLLLSVLLIGFAVKSIDRIIYFKTINEEVDLLSLRMESMDLDTREFMYEGYKSNTFLEGKQAPTIVSFNDNYLQSKKLIQEIAAESADEKDSKRSQELLAILDRLETDFHALVTLLQKRGFKDFGLEGSLRKAIHEVENSPYEYDKVDLLMLRRHEKDFFLRKDLKYQDEFLKRIDLFKEKLGGAGSGQLITFLDNYSKEFNNVVDIEKQIGLTENEGLRGRIRNYFIEMRPYVASIRTSTKEQNEEQIASTQWILWLIFGVQIIVGVSMALLYADLLTKSIKEIRNGMQKLADGLFPEKLHVKTTEEIGQTKMAFNQFIDRLRTATTFAESLGSGELNAQYDDQFANDVLAKSLISAQDKLKSAEERQRKINWINEGAARFSDILKNDEEEVTALADRIVKLMINYVGANQGALYLLRGSSPDAYLERIATYAYEKKKFQDEKIDLGSGQIGQCALEGETIYLKDIPTDYVRITSGLGEATPRNVLIVPLKVRGRIVGILELASFLIIEPYQFEFIERMAENIATMLAGKQTAAETKQLLQESEQRASALAQQEEEMRQNAEELQATQEEMERQRSAMQDEIKALKSKVLTYEVIEQV